MIVKKPEQEAFATKGLVLCFAALVMLTDTMHAELRNKKEVV